MLKRIGDALYRDAVVVSKAVLGDTCHWVLTPARRIELLSFTSHGLRGLKLWDGSRLPRDLAEADASRASGSRKGNYSAEEIEAAVELAAAQPADSVVGTRVQLPAATRSAAVSSPVRRVRGKTSLSRVGAKVAGSPLSADGSPVPDEWKKGDDMTRIRSAIMARLGPIALDDLPEASLPDLQAAVKAADVKIRAGKRTLAVKNLQEAVRKALGTAAVDGSEAEDDVQIAADEEWFAMFKVGPLQPGDKVDMSRRKHLRMGDSIIFENGPERSVAYLATESARLDKLREWQILSSGRSASQFEGLKDIWADRQGTPRGDADLESDIRVCPVHFEKDGRRHRRLEDAEQDYVEDPFDDWPILGDRVMANTCRELRRNGTDFLRQHEVWVQRSGVNQNDRSVHEHAVIARALHWLSTCDQLNLPNICGAEALELRRQLIEKAHEANPLQPCHEGAEDFLGFQECTTGAIIDQRRVQYWSNRLKARATVSEHLRKAREEQTVVKAAVVKAAAKGKGKPNGRLQHQPTEGGGDGK